MAILIDYTNQYTDGPSFFTGSGNSSLVPYLFPVAIAGHVYMIDTSANAFTRQFDGRVRDSVDQSTEPGEAAINPQGLWRRSQSSWHYGAGQQYSDTADAEAYRFYSSKGVDVWNKGQLTLLPATSLAYSTSGTNLYAATADTRLYITDGQNVKYTTDLSTFTTVTSTNASALYSIASNGYTVFFSYADGDIDQTNAGTGAASDYITGIEAGKISYVKGRLMVAGQAADKHKIWNITTAPGSSANNPSPLYTHPNTNFTWVGFAAGQQHIYCAGHAGNKTLVYRTEVKADGTALDIPVVAAELPFGEIVTSIHGYLGYVVIGLEDGFRFCSADDNGNLLVGPKIVTGTQVDEFAGIGQYLYFSWKNFDSTSTGVGRMDVSVFVSTNQPAYASDLMATGQGAVTDVHEFAGKPIFMVSGLGLYKQHATDLVASGYLRSGVYRWGVPDAKIIPKWDVRTLPLLGSFSLSASIDDGTFRVLSSQSTIGSKESTFNGFEPKAFQAEAKLTLTRSATNNAEGPTITRWMARAYAAPLRAEIFTVPLIMSHRLNVKGVEYWMDVDAELRFLRGLVSDPQVITFQYNDETFAAVVEDVRWEGFEEVSEHNNWDWEGRATILIRTVR